MKANFFTNRYEKWGFPQEEITLSTVIRLNTLKKTIDEIRITLGFKPQSISYLTHGYIAQTTFKLASSPPYLHGYIYLQEAASQIPVHILKPRDNDVVLDMCAAPGSKTTQIAQYMRNTGTLIALDPNRERLVKLAHNLERCGVTNCIAIKMDGVYASDLNLEFDKVLLDAPCAGNFAIDAEWFEKRDLQSVRENVPTQKNLLQTAARVLKVGGTLVYSTCSLEIEENEEVVEWALENLPLELVPITFGVGSPGLTPQTTGCLRMWPAQHKTSGFFIAHLRKV